MSARRGGKKKAQTKQQTILPRLQFDQGVLTVSAAAAAGADADGNELLASARPAFAKPLHAAPSPVVALARRALTPVVAAASRAAAAAVLAAAPRLPSVLKEAQDDDDGQPVSTDSHGLEVDQDGNNSHPHEGILPSTPRAANLVADGPPSLQDQALDAPALSGPAEQHEEELHGTEGLAGDTGVAAAAASSLSRLRAGAAACAARLRQHLPPAAGQQLLAPVLVIAVLAVMLAVQGTTIKAHARAMQQQQAEAAHQARVLQELTRQLQDASAQLPDLKHAADMTSTSLSRLSEDHAALHSRLAALTNATSQLHSSVSSVNASSQQGQRAWQLLAPLAAGCSVVDDDDTDTGCGAGPPGSNHTPPSAASPGADWLERRLARAQEQQAAAQQALLAQELAQQLPAVDLALADCGARIVASTTVNLSTAAAAATPALQRSRRLSTHNVLPTAVRAGWAALRRVVPARLLEMGGRPVEAPAAAVAAAAGPSASGMSPQQLALLHHIVLRPASALLPATAACVHFDWSARSSSSLGPAVLEIQLPQLAHVSSVTLHAPGGGAGMGADDSSCPLSAAPGKVTVLLANSSSCGGAMAACTSLTAGSSAAAAGLTVRSEDDGAAAGRGSLAGAALLPGVEHVSQPASLDMAAYSSGGGSSGRAVVLARGTADRVILVVSDTLGGGGEVSAPHGPCFARVSVQGRPNDASGFC